MDLDGSSFPVDWCQSWCHSWRQASQMSNRLDRLCNRSSHAWHRLWWASAHQYECIPFDHRIHCDQNMR